MQPSLLEACLVHVMLCFTQLVMHLVAYIGDGMLVEVDVTGSFFSNDNQSTWVVQQRQDLHPLHMSLH